MGYNFIIEYKADITNKATNAHSRKDGDAKVWAISIPTWPDWDQIAAKVMANETLERIIQEIKQGTATLDNYSLIQDRLYYKRRLAIPVGLSQIPKLISKFHTTPSHSSAYHTYWRKASNFYWKGMMSNIQKFVATCYVCQTTRLKHNPKGGWSG